MENTKRRGQLRTLQWVAERLGVRRSTVHVWKHRGQLPGVVMVGKRTPRVDEDAFEAWLAAGGGVVGQ
jgi:excisionase family DNA binding protein